MQFATSRYLAGLMSLVAGLASHSMARDRDPICLMYLTG